MRVFLKIAFFSLLIFQLCSCKEKESNPNQNLQLSAFSTMKTRQFTIDVEKIRSHIAQMAKTDADSLVPDYRTRDYYRNKGVFLWIDRLGVDVRTDTLLMFLHAVDAIGFSPEKFYTSIISDDLKRIRTLDFDDHRNTINSVLARLEYHLTKAYLRYVNGQRFGFADPYALFNKLDVRKRDSLNVSYYRLFDIPLERPQKNFWSQALQKVQKDSVSAYLHHIQPGGALYKELKKRLPKAVNNADKVQILCNLERARWRLYDEPEKHRKYAMVNIPSMHLVARDGDSVLSMRIGVGAMDTKTPLLTSKIMRMDVNPQWVMPKSIIEKNVVQHAGNTAYFDSHRYFIRERKSGKRMAPSQVSADMLRSGRYNVIQEGGKGNAMGRIVFRFKNNFSVYLHDTSSKSVFEKENREVSHGCVRLEKPFDFAVFLMDKKDKDTIGRISYSMAADIHSVYKENTGEEGAQPADTLKRAKLIKSVGVKPEIPLFITYYTLYPNEQKVMTSYRDIYGFDQVIYRHLLNYIR